MSGIIGHKQCFNMSPLNIRCWEAGGHGIGAHVLCHFLPYPRNHASYVPEGGALSCWQT
jgi:hypothetical protein